MSDWFENFDARKQRKREKEESGEMDFRRQIVKDMHSGLITLEEGQEKLRQFKKKLRRSEDE